MVSKFQSWPEKNGRQYFQKDVLLVGKALRNLQDVADWPRRTSQRRVKANSRDPHHSHIPWLDQQPKNPKLSPEIPIPSRPRPRDKLHQRNFNPFFFSENLFHPDLPAETRENQLKGQPLSVYINHVTKCTTHF